MRRTALLGALIAALALPGSAFGLSASFTFDTGNQTWVTNYASDCNSNAPIAAAWSGSEGNPGGGIQGTDSAPLETGVETCYWYAVAPRDLTGNLKANYGGLAGYQVKYPTTGADFAGRMIIQDSGLNQLVGTVNSPSAPPAENIWTTYLFPLIETTPNVTWTYHASGGGSAPATQANFFDVLGTVTAVAFLGDLDEDTIGQTTSIDNIGLGEPASPRDEDGDGVTNASDNCPLQAGVVTNAGCPATAQPPATPPTTDDACNSAKDKLRKAKKKLRKLRRQDASDRKIETAEQKVEKAKQHKQETCAAPRLVIPRLRLDVDHVAVGDDVAAALGAQ
jgi:hypothetical protein